ncbi:diacylglycerol kinase [Brucella abortus]|nr:diacylglycerol kinase [Brucella abortus]
MLPAPEKILLTALQTAAPAFCDLFSIEFHRTPRPLKKGGNAQYCVHHIDSGAIAKFASFQASLFADPSGLLQHFCCNYERCVNFEGFPGLVNNLLILSEMNE